MEMNKNGKSRFAERVFRILTEGWAAKQICGAIKSLVTAGVEEQGVSAGQWKYTH